MRKTAQIFSLSALLLGTLSITGCGAGDSSPPTARATLTPASQAGLPAPDTDTATVTWEAPTENTSGTALTDLSGFRIYYGSDPENLTSSVTLDGPGLLTYVIEGLPVGTTYYFAVTALASDGAESALSAVVAKTIA